MRMGSFGLDACDMSEGTRSASPVRLIGDEDVILVAEGARAAIDADPRLARELLPGLASLWRARQVAATPLWSVLLGAALVSMLTCTDALIAQSRDGQPEWAL